MGAIYGLASTSDLEIYVDDEPFEIFLENDLYDEYQTATASNIVFDGSGSNDSDGFRSVIELLIIMNFFLALIFGAIIGKSLFDYIRG